MDEMTVVVTGASRGIGRSVAAAFAAEAAHVVACARDEEALDDLADELAEAGGTIRTERADVRDEFDMERLMELAARQSRPIDVLVACAAVNHGTPGEMPTAEESYARFDDTMRTNVRGVFAAVKEAVPHMADDARVLIPSESVAREARAGMGVYAVSKAADEALARGFSADLSQTVGVVDPGPVATELTGGEGRDADDIAPMFVWAATEADADDLDGEILDHRTWKNATR
ncbi:SDR family NAD(P)-dependent oxidoreductase [Haloprofundus salinisoli]|uniref:SDR family NAD(P)-dependent oxidoreductase n=1 Tax=Haloprofundus salinisoli TaxID=2876193 RepID=UPI001CC918EC|nr:SDR family NAD(P)-dependent oxidoreductase [Haloprofundus salinisoli]